MVDKKDLENQDFIEGEDDLANSLENMDFEPVDHDDIPAGDVFADDSIDETMADIDMDDPATQDADFIDADIEDEWAEDFGDDLDAEGDFSAYDADPIAARNGGGLDKPERNWFNIGVFGVLGLGVCFILYSYLPGMLGGGDGASHTPVQTAQPQQQPNNDISVMAEQDAATNTDLAQQALSPDVEMIEQAGGLLANPALLGDGVESPDRPDPEAADNRVFEALNENVEMANQDVDNIFSALENLQNEQKGQGHGGTGEISQTNTTSALPQPADSIGTGSYVEDDSILAGLDEFANAAPRTPPQDDMTVTRQNTGVENLAASVTDMNAHMAVENPPAELDETEDVFQTESANNQSVKDPVAESSVSSSHIDALNTRMDTIMARLDSLAQQIESRNASVVATQTSSAGESSAVAAMENTIRNLEKRIETLSRAKEIQSASKPAAAPRKTPVKTSKPKRPAAAVKWELRGASPGNAYVAEKGTQNLRTVGIGDSLSGVGRITSIAVESGRWVVRGTSGNIYQ